MCYLFNLVLLKQGLQMHHTKGCLVSFDLTSNAFIFALQRGFSLGTHPSAPERLKEVKAELGGGFLLGLDFFSYVLFFR